MQAGSGMFLDDKPRLFGLSSPRAIAGFGCLLEIPFSCVFPQRHKRKGVQEFKEFKELQKGDAGQR